jgi:hypothetical protein
LSNSGASSFRDIFSPYYRRRTEGSLNREEVEMFDILAHLFKKKIMCGYLIVGKENYDKFTALCAQFGLVGKTLYKTSIGTGRWTIEVAMPNYGIRDQFNSIMEDEKITADISEWEHTM